ncbi:unnamed protein product [Arabidopsis lyrata]|uniref:Uncharacterized protein n=3 Tax=Arabidopsis TaxID=3701 RepID=D7MWI0_ARALL|nr:hypothetical protein ARALYDRAFT_920216 [Arabidopsis lyrata subsp. lyrata]KAG7578005.1 hypothetical protein ISN45_Aa03g022300 [Arabidopsis thaliana x Arabidopsis arenosa]KAG7582701.1 hypothetical protein ISN44_As08g022700 [Arabidopsis suecica]CAH8261197.1 unnamed protein product [Arabidopsis lyrata]KAG7578011.1 hypothetical protein ISN45_Aa03g022380 [Arabidopsis thaliana x Arabidopsis arenosa]
MFITMHQTLSRKLNYWLQIRATTTSLQPTDDTRERSAIGMMASYYALLDQVRDVKLDDSTTKLNELISVSFAKLEKYVFRHCSSSITD